MKNLLKVIELELRSNNKLSLNTWNKLSDLNEWDFQIVQHFITEVNLYIKENNNNLLYKKYIDNLLNNDNPFLKDSRIKYDLLIAVTKRNQNDLVLTDVINRLVIPEKISFRYFEVWGLPVDKARNVCIDKAFEYGCEHILFIDDDMIVENTALIKLWETIQETKSIVVSANYNKKADYDITAHGSFFSAAKKDDSQNFAVEPLNKDYLKYTDLCAMGFTLINLHLLSQKVPSPYFWVFLAPDGKWALGEDAFFTKKLIEYTKEFPVIDFRPSILHYDKNWKKIFGKRNKDVTYATNTIDTFEKFDFIRQPPSYPLVNICIPKRKQDDPVATNFESLLCLRGFKVEHTSIYGLPVDQARNELATNSVKMGSKYTFFVDDDIILPENSLVQMMEFLEDDKNREYGMVVGDYLLKGKVNHSIHLQLEKSGVVTELNRIKNKDSELDSNWLVGLGCALIRTEVFRQLQFPWFQCYSPKLNKIGADMIEEGGINEDAHFSELLFENGYKIKILRNIKCGHVDFQNRKIFGLDKNIEYSNFDWINQFQIL